MTKSSVLGSRVSGLILEFDTPNNSVLCHSSFPVSHYIEPTLRLLFLPDVMNLDLDVW